jgi:hypothetical protein
MLLVCDWSVGFESNCHRILHQQHMFMYTPWLGNDSQWSRTTSTYSRSGVRPCLCGTATATGPIVHPSHDMSEYGTAVEWSWQGKQKDSNRNLSQCHFVHHKFYMDCSGLEPGPPQWEAGLSCGPAAEDLKSSFWRTVAAELTEGRYLREWYANGP